LTKQLGKNDNTINCRITGGNAVMRRRSGKEIKTKDSKKEGERTESRKIKHSGKVYLS